MDRQPLEVQTLYAELLEQLAALDARRAIGHLPGSFVTKTVKGQDYYYFQHMEPGGTRRQVYLGKKDELLDGVARNYARSRDEFNVDQASVQRLCSLLRVGGAMMTDAPSARVLGGLADAGVFRLGGVLVGTHAFIVIGNLLGVRWASSALRTQDVDLATSPLSVAISNVTADVPGALESLEMGFFPVPGLDPKSPSTSFKVRGQGLRLDLLTPSKASDPGPVPIPRFRTAAQPLPFLDYLMKETVRAAVVDGGGVLVTVPDPARFAVHKLVLAAERPAAMHSKRDKDLSQASQILETLLDERPGDVLRAWEDVAAYGKAWVKRAAEGLRAMAGMAPDVARGVEGLVAKHS